LYYEAFRVSESLQVPKYLFLLSTVNTKSVYLPLQSQDYEINTL